MSETVPKFELCPLMAQALPAAIAMHWRVSEKLVQSLVGFKVSHSLTSGQVVPLNQAGAKLLQELGLSSLVVDRRSATRS